MNESAVSFRQMMMFLQIFLTIRIVLFEVWIKMTLRRVWVLLTARKGHDGYRKGHCWNAGPVKGG